VNFQTAIEELNKDLPNSIKITKEEIAVTEFVFIVNEDVKSAELSVDRLKERPNDIQSTPGDGRVYQYLSIEKENITD